MEQKLKKKINIIDPVSTEFNRGSFCYAPYLAYNAFSEAGEDVVIYETFRPEDVDLLRKADINLVCLWSYPQIETATLLSQILPFEYGKDNVYFIGYTPLIHHLGLRHVEDLLNFDPLQDESFLFTAMLAYPEYFKDFNRLLLSDCDMHLQDKQSDAIVHPLFTTYGCPNGCAFCPSTENCGRWRFVLPIEDTLNLLEHCLAINVNHIHFTDEDFFFDIDRLHEILTWMKGKGFRCIALGSSEKVLAYIEKYSANDFKEAGLEVIEIGFESAAENISEDMGAGKSAAACLRLAKMQHQLPVHIFWLVQTFFPGETIKSLNTTGKFMREYGFDIHQVVGRLRTNGTKGGLGQFFQPYHGLRIRKKIADGVFLTDRPIRLIPSFLPNSFLDSVIEKVHPDRLNESVLWLRLYNNPPIEKEFFESIKGKSLRELIMIHPDRTTQLKKAIIYAILARMEVIE